MEFLASRSFPFLFSFLVKINSAIKKAYDPAKKAYTTYFINEVIKYEALNRLDPIKNAPLVRPIAFKSIRLPLFLEGPVRALKVEEDAKKAGTLYKALRKTKLYDFKLKMYKINEPLDGVSKEVGRSSIFTPGWLENESIWLHMEYKYLLEILKKGLYKEFFTEFKNILIPFQRPERYGRSIFENSSFIVSSAFPDARMHGRGFVARLSGSTAEMINIWLVMSAGREPFFVNEKGEFVPIDFKTRGYPTKEDTAAHYQTQLDLYALLFKENGHSVASYGYLLFFWPKKYGGYSADFNTELVNMEISPERGLNTLKEVVRIVKGREAPAHSDCEFCRFREFDNGDD